jgi:hypothetical protein
LRRIITTLGAVLLLALFALPGAAMARGHRHHPRASADRNHDRIPDRWEKRNHLSLRVNQAKRDQDRDGLNNLSEFRSHTNPRDADTDNDGVNDANEDADHDGVDNGNEQDEHTNPGVHDTNHNGTPDGSEDADHDGLDNHGEDVTGNDPENRDTDGDGTTDGHENAGKVTSFDGTTLVITLGNGQTVSGTVNGDTRIRCENEQEHEVEADETGGSTTPQSHEDGGNDSGHHGHDGEHAHECSSADLTADTPVHEAELRSTSTGLVFEKVELVK